MDEMILTKELRTLAIDPEFHELIPPLTDEEKKMLEDSIVANGCETPLIVWNGFIVDGHNRYDICRKHEIPFAVVEKHFENRDAALIWMITTQLGRRNLTTYQKSELALKFEPLLKAQAKERQATSTGGTTPQLTQNSAEAEDKPNVKALSRATLLTLLFLENFTTAGVRGEPSILAC